MPEFRPLKKGKLPKPFHRIGGSRLAATALIDVSDDHVALFMWRNGDILTDTAFYAYLLCRLKSQALCPVLEFHWHPSHKGLHCKIPCQTQIDYTGRMLPGAPELSLSGRKDLDARKEGDRLVLIHEFCRAAGIALVSKNDAIQNPLWTQ